MSWYISQDNTQNIAISSRIRLARNLPDFAFPRRLDKAKADTVVEKVKNAFHDYCQKQQEKELVLLVDSLAAEEKNSLLEQHLLSAEMLNGNLPRALLLTETEKQSVLVNEEDHLRIQSMDAGFSLDDVASNAFELAGFLEAELSFARSEEFGYLTCCPTNTGTGMRASVMLHLPALLRLGLLNRLKDNLLRAGYAMRGINGEGSPVSGDLVQISNQRTLGCSETDILINLTSLVHNLLEQEEKYRQQILKQKGMQLEDDIYRAYAVLKGSVLLSYDELLGLLSLTRLGAGFGWQGLPDFNTMQKLLFETGDNMLLKKAHSENAEHVNIRRQRALMVQDLLKGESE